MAEDVISAGTRTRPKNKKNTSRTFKTKATMEENNNLTAERSLEIITEQIERSRRIVAKDTGELLFISGL